MSWAQMALVRRPRGENAWYAAMGSAVVVGDVLAVLVFEPAAVMLIAVSGGIVGATVAGTKCLDDFDDPPPVPPDRRAAVVLSLTLLAAAGLVATASVMAALGRLGLVVVLALALTSPPVVRRLRSRGAGARERDSGTSAPDVLASSSADDLCRRWRTTTANLSRPAFRAHTALLVEARAAILDELERRDPDAFARWVATGADDHQVHLAAGRERSAGPDDAGSG